MTRNDIDQIARAIRDAKPIRLLDHDPRLTPWTNCAVELARSIAATNARFDRHAFYDACGVRMADRQ